MSLNELKDQIKEAPISSIISNYISLTKRGNIHLGLCPFHNDTKPSLTVNDNKQLFMCFVCQNGGDSIAFVEKYKKIGFQEALKEISKVIGLSYDNYVLKKKVSPKMAQANKILSKAKKLYFKIAEDKSPPPFKHFIKSRKLTANIVHSFSLGFAPENSCFNHYLKSIPDEKERQYALELAAEIHLIGKDKNNPNAFYDVFRDRIMFPIHDQFGKMVGFGSRAIHDFQKAKYLNSKESFCFNKKNILYGYHLAKTHIREKNSVILVEGYMDLITLHQHGLVNSVAVMGVALGQYCLSALKSLTNNFYLALDSDPAGLNAMIRINELCLNNGIIPKIIDFTPLKDPDEFINEKGAIEFQKLIDNAVPLIDKLLEQEIPKKIPDIADAKLDIFQKMCRIVAPLKENLAAVERLVQMGQRLGLQSDATQITSFYKEFLKTYKSKVPYKSYETQKQDSKMLEIETNKAKTSDNISSSKIKSETISKAEKIFVTEIVKYPELFTHRDINGLLEYVDNNSIKGYLKKLKELVYEIDEAEYQPFILDMLKDDDYSLELRELVGIALFNYQHHIPNEDTTNKLISDIKKKLQESKLINEKKDIIIRQNSCLNQAEKNLLIKELIIIEKKLNSLKSHKTKGSIDKCRNQ